MPGFFEWGGRSARALELGGRNLLSLPRFMGLSRTLSGPSRLHCCHLPGLVAVCKTANPTTMKGMWLFLACSFVAEMSCAHGLSGGLALESFLIHKDRKLLIPQLSVSGPTCSDFPHSYQEQTQKLAGKDCQPAEKPWGKKSSTAPQASPPETRHEALVRVGWAQGDEMADPTLASCSPSRCWCAPSSANGAHVVLVLKGDDKSECG